MFRTRSVGLSLGLLAALLWAGMPASSQSQRDSSSDAGLRGTVKSADGKPMEGVAVTARAEGKTFSTSVWTNKSGDYSFPALDDGRYKVWAQAVGFELTRAEQTIASGKKIQQDFTLKSTPIPLKALSDSEWLNSLPDTPQDSRMKKVLLNQMPGFQYSLDAKELDDLIAYLQVR